MLLQFQTVTVFLGNQQIAYTLGEEIQPNIGLQREIVLFNFVFKVLDTNCFDCFKIMHSVGVPLFIYLFFFAKP